MNLFRKQDRGFTLLELIIVVAVLGILAGVTLPSFTDLRDDATRESTRVGLRNIQTSLEQYYYGEGNGAYPTDLSTINVDNTNYTYNSTNDETYVCYYDTTMDDGSGTAGYYYIDSTTDGVAHNGDDTTEPSEPTP